MNKEQLELKLAEYTDKYTKVMKLLQEYEIISHKLQGAIETIDNLLKEIVKENKE
jgi:hypothetical protein